MMLQNNSGTLTMPKAGIFNSVNQCCERDGFMIRMGDIATMVTQKTFVATVWMPTYTVECLFLGTVNGAIYLLCLPLANHAYNPNNMVGIIIVFLIII
jgi:hypothetical protein